MVYFLWTLLNLFLVIFFIVICFKATKLLKEKHGILVSLIFIVGIFSIMGTSAKSDASSNNSNGKSSVLFNLSEQDLDHTKSGDVKSIAIDKKGLTTFNLQILFGYFKGSNTPLPYQAYSEISGLMGGHEWSSTTTVNKTSQPGHFSYNVTGILKWKLLWMSIYSQPITYEGFFDIPTT